MRPQSGHKVGSPFGVGVITIFMVLIVLCLTILATLTLSTARADLRLSRINAEMVTAYYAADAEAAEYYAAFAAGTDAYFEESIPVTDTQVLYVGFGRDGAGRPVILAWQTMSTFDTSDWGEFILPVWPGE